MTSFQDWVKTILITAAVLTVVFLVMYGGMCLTIDMGRAIMHP